MALHFEEQSGKIIQAAYKQTTPSFKNTNADETLYRSTDLQMRSHESESLGHESESLGQQHCLPTQIKRSGHLS